MSKSQIFLALCLAFLVGVFIQSIINVPGPVWLGILILGVSLDAIFWSKNKKIVVTGFCLAILALAAWRFDQAANPANSIRNFNDQGRIIFQGLVVDEPDVRADNIKYKIETAQGDILLVVKKYPVYRYGDVLEVQGKLKTPSMSETFDYQRYLAKDDIYSIIYYPEIKIINSGQGNWFKEKLFWLKNKFEGSIELILAEPQAAFLAGLLLGAKRGLPLDLMADFSRTGTTHIIALSGYNITIIAFALASVFNFFMLRRSVSFWLSVLVIVLFVVMTGSSASAVRAAVMGILILLARHIGRLYTIKNALIFAGALMVWFSPKVLVFDLGFQLSFAATLGLIYLSPILKRWFSPSENDDLLAGQAKETPKIILSLKEILIATLSAQLAVLPLLVINFGQLSLIAPLANILILPFIPLTMFFGFLAGLAGLVWLGLGQVFGWLAWLLLSYEIKIIELLAKIPLAALTVKWNWWAGLIYYAILIYLVWYFGKVNKDSVIAKHPHA